MKGCIPIVFLSLILVCGGQTVSGQDCDKQKEAFLTDAAGSVCEASSINLYDMLRPDAKTEGTSNGDFKGGIFTLYDNSQSPPYNEEIKNPETFNPATLPRPAAPGQYLLYYKPNYSPTPQQKWCGVHQIHIINNPVATFTSPLSACSGREVNILASGPPNWNNVIDANQRKYNWALIGSDPNVTGASAGGTTPVAEVRQTLTLNNTTTTQQVRYSITPVAVYSHTQCAGTPSVVVVEVRAVPVLSGIDPPGVCAGLTTLKFKMDNFPDGTPGHFSYRSGGAAGLAPGPVEDQVNPVQLENNTRNDITVTLERVTVKYAVGSTAAQACPSDPETIIFIVKATPKITIPTPRPLGIKEADNGVDFLLTLCNGENFPETSNTQGLKFSSDPVVPIENYSWTNDKVVRGMSAGNTATIPNFMATNRKADGNDLTGMFTMSAGQSAGSCAGTAKLLVTVHPSPFVKPDLVTQEVCSRTESLAVTFSATPGGCTFSWETDPNLPALDGFAPTRGIGNMAPATAINTTNAIFTIFFIATATKNYPATNTSDEKNCTGTGTYKIKVNPSPTVSVPDKKTICNGESVAVALLPDPANPNNGVPNTLYTWISDRPDLGGKENAIPAEGPIRDVLSLPNGSVAQVHSIYTITPVANKCPGISSNIDITVSPLPVAITTPVPPESATICDKGWTNIALSNTFHDNNIRYVWTAEQNGISGGRDSHTQDRPGYRGSSNGNPPVEGDNIIDQLSLTGVSGGTVVYFVKAISGICVSAQATIQIITVRGRPGIELGKDLNRLTYCADHALTLAIESTRTTDQYKWYFVNGPDPHTPLTDTPPYSGTATRTLTINHTPDAFSGNQYQVEVVDKDCPNATSLSNIALITSQFSEVEAAANKSSLTYGEKATFTVNAPEGAVVRWDFGDTWYSEEKEAVHYYYSKGIFTPKITVDVQATTCHWENTLPTIEVTGAKTDGDVVTGDGTTGGLAVYPVPATDKITVKSAGISSLTMYNAQGEKLLEEEGKEAIELSISGYPQGLYFLKVNDSAGEHFVKIIKE